MIEKKPNDLKVAEQLDGIADEELSDQIADLMYDDDETPMSDEGYNAMLEKWQASGASTADLPKIDKLSYSIRKGEGKEQVVYVGEDKKRASYDPFAVYGIDDIDDETAIRNEMADYVISYVNGVLEKHGEELGYREVMDSRAEENAKQVFKNQDIIQKIREEAKATEDFVCLKERLQTIIENTKADCWAKIDYDTAFDFSAGITFGTATEANIVLIDLQDPDAKIWQTRIFTGDHGFEKQEKKLVGEELAQILSGENEARSAWAERMKAEPAIGANRNSQMPTKKPRSIRRK